MGRRAVTSQEDLASSALAVVRRSGTAGVSSRAIAAEAGVAVGTVYRHVPDLRSLLVRVAETVQAGFVDDLRAAAPDDEPLVPAIPAVAAALASRARTEPRLTELLALPVLTDTVTDGAAIRKWISARISRAMLAGEIIVADPALVAAASFGLVRGVLAHALQTDADWPAVTAVLAAGLTGLIAAQPSAAN